MTTLKAVGIYLLFLLHFIYSGSEGRPSDVHPDQIIAERRENGADFQGGAYQDSHITGSDKHVHLVLPVKQGIKGSHSNQQFQKWQPYAIWKDSDAQSEIFPSFKEKDENSKHIIVAHTVHESNHSGLNKSKEESKTNITTTIKEQEYTPTTSLSVEEKTNIFQISYETSTTGSEEGNEQKVESTPKKDDHWHFLPTTIPKKDDHWHFLPTTIPKKNVSEDDLHKTHTSTIAYDKESKQVTTTTAPSASSTVHNIDNDAFNETFIVGQNSIHGLLESEHPSSIPQSKQNTDTQNPDNSLRRHDTSVVHNTASYHPEPPSHYHEVKIERNLGAATEGTFLSVSVPPTHTTTKKEGSETTSINYSSINPHDSESDYTNKFNSPFPISSTTSLVSQSTENYKNHSLIENQTSEEQIKSSTNRIESFSSSDAKTPHGYEVYESTEASMRTVGSIFKEMFFTTEINANISTTETTRENTTQNNQTQFTNSEVTTASNMNSTKSTPIDSGILDIKSEKTEQTFNPHNVIPTTTTTTSTTTSTTTKQEVHEVFHSTVINKPCERTTKPSTTTESHYNETDIVQKSNHEDFPKKDGNSTDFQQKHEEKEIFHQIEETPIMKIDHSIEESLQQTAVEYVKEIQRVLDEHGEDSYSGQQEKQVIMRIPPEDYKVINNFQKKEAVEKIPLEIQINDKDLQEKKNDSIGLNTTAEQKHIDSLNQKKEQGDTVGYSQGEKKFESSRNESLEVTEQETIKPVVNVVTEISVVQSFEKTDEEKDEKNSGFLKKAGEAIKEYIVNPLTKVFGRR